MIGQLVNLYEIKTAFDVLIQGLKSICGTLKMFELGESLIKTWLHSQSEGATWPCHNLLYDGMFITILLGW